MSAETHDFIRRITAPERHEWRVQQAAYAALKEALQIHPAYSPESFPEETLRKWSRGEWDGLGLYSVEPYGPFRLAILLCEMESRGRGGPNDMGLHDGIGCRATDRMPWAKVLGRGRHWAGDGAAWTAAIEDAARRLRELLRAAKVVWAEDDDDLLLIGGPFAVSECRRRIASEFRRWRQISEERESRDWAASLATHAERMVDLSVILEELVGNFASPQPVGFEEPVK
jgi:hypothetical protein